MRMLNTEDLEPALVEFKRLADANEHQHGHFCLAMRVNLRQWMTNALLNTSTSARFVAVVDQRVPWR